MDNRDACDAAVRDSACRDDESGPSSVYQVWVKCIHRDEKAFRSIPAHYKFKDLVSQMHPESQSDVKCQASPDGKEWMEVEFLGLTLADMASFSIKYIKISCNPAPVPDTSAQPQMGRTANAFAILMTHEKMGPPLKSGISLTRKEELYNDIVNLLVKEGGLFDKSLAVSEGTYIVQVLTNALWYITNQHMVINDAATYKKKVQTVPDLFKDFQGYNEVKRKKTKEKTMTFSQLSQHSEILFAICCRPVMKSNQQWIQICEAIKNLAECLRCYAEHLKDQLENRNRINQLDHPARQVSQHCYAAFRPAGQSVSDQYALLNNAAIAVEGQPVFLCGETHLRSPFTSNYLRFRYFENLHLSVPVDIFKYSPGRGHLTVVCVVQVPEDRKSSEIVNQTARTIAKIKPKFPEIHTRLMKRTFKERLARIVKVSGCVADYIYKELALDAAVATHPDTQQRLKMIALGEPGLLTDLRHLNAGRPPGTFDIFFEKLAEIVEDVTAADERRHNVAHMSEWLSLEDLIKEASAKCPDGTTIPSKATVRLQFAPRNPYARTALSFTSKIQVQHKIQRRQLRLSHPDDHYCAALLLYMKNMAVALRGSGCAFYSVDDKAKINVGEPGVVLFTGVRGKQTLAPSTTTLVAADHDVHHLGSITPSVYLKVDVPEEAKKSFVRGQVYVHVNDSVFQSSNPFRHAAAMIDQIKSSENSTPGVLLKFSDGGTDQRNNLESVKCSLICIFKELYLDLLVAARCAPGHSWTNPAERVMSILNIGLQNCALERQKCSDTIETKLKKCGSMKEVREAATKMQEVEPAWQESVAPAIDIIRTRFERFALKERPIMCRDPVPEADIVELKRHLYVFPGLDVTKLTKATTKKLKEYQQWLNIHCRERQYCTQFRKCENSECCKPTQLPREKLMWLPDPILDETGEHYRSYSEVSASETSEKDRPSLQAKSPIPPKATVLSSEVKCLLLEEDLHALTGDSSVYTAQNARAIVHCTQCQKPRVVYAKTRLTVRHNTQLATVLSQYEYTCGAPIYPPGHSFSGKLYTRLTMTCESVIEFAYYSSSIGRSNLCCYCGTENSGVDPVLKKTVQDGSPLM